ncbi:MAG: CoB--CoM heterodisulfide reductase iron-sulfur subunit A family protein [Deltaproteobacteria bacterium]|nr:CoB--CoM heterodisulfide reductase iron-sulfur subunit A family protein [Deltaproteobacteria bacterium]
MKRHPRYIDPDKCIACGACAEKCPKSVPDPYNVNLSRRKAVYIKYGQTVPLKYAIDGDACIYIQKGKCRACEKFCPTGAVDFDDAEAVEEVNVGSIILAPGFLPYDPTGVDHLGMGRIPDVVTSLQFERLLSPSGPSLGHVTRISDNRDAKKVAWIQCVGSRNINRADNPYCSSVCCMYALKQARVAAEHLHGDCELTIFYMDMRCHGKEFDRYLEGAKEAGVRLVRARPHTIDPGKNDTGVVMTWATEEGRTEREAFDLAVLSTGMETTPETRELAGKLGISMNAGRFAETGSFAPVESSVPGVFVTGAFLSPKDIPQAVTEASAAAASASRSLARSRGTLARKKTWPAQRDILGEEPRCGVFVCSCGVNIAGVVDVQGVAEFASRLPGVVHVENNLFTCSTDTQELITKRIREHGLNRVVVAACTPRTHEAVFADTLRESGLSPFLLEMANIRNQCSWVHAHDPAAATEKAKDQVRMAVAKVCGNLPLVEPSMEVVPRALVVGGGLSGMTAALSLADQGFEAVLVEKEPDLGGNARWLSATWKGEPVAPALEDLVARVESHPKVTVYKNAEVETVSGSVGHFTSTIRTQGGPVEVSHGAAVLAVGGVETTPVEYLYGEDSRVLTHKDLDTRWREDPGFARNVQSAVFIQCVGSRDERRPYCSRVCCTHALESAVRLKEENPEARAFVLYRDIRTYGLREELFQKARKLGVLFIRYVPEDKPVAEARGEDLSVTVYDPVVRRKVQIAADLLVLAAAIEPAADGGLLHHFHAGKNEDGFFSEAHPKLRPVDMSADGVFVAGLCHYPKPVDESIAQALAAASRAGALLSRDRVVLNAAVSEQNEKICMACLACFRACPFGSPYINAEGKVRHDPVKCTGCGICAGVCPAKAFSVKNMRDDQIVAMIDALTRDLWEGGQAG